ncbi:MAG: DUF1848 domain-containing protein [Lachnospiraceae bacterium]
MIISASRRTDIPALYPEWFVNRLRDGEVLIPNPYNRKKITSIRLTPDTVDCIVFWTKNPEPLLPYLKEIDDMGYRYCFQMTVTDYEKDVEPGVPELADAMATFLLLSEKIGKENIDWRFDPVFLNDKYTVNYHTEKFELMCEWLHNATERCIFSYLDSYKGCPYPEMSEEEMKEVGKRFSKIAAKYNLPIYTCAEKIDLEEYGIRHGACIDKERIHNLTGYKLDLKKDSGQRKECRCAASIDVGMYDTCIHGCTYCYATKNIKSAEKRKAQHNVNAPILVGTLHGDESIKEKELQTSKDNQISLFDLPEMYSSF